MEMSEYLPLAADASSGGLEALVRLCLTPPANLGWQEPALPVGLNLGGTEISQLSQLAQNASNNAARVVAGQHGGRAVYAKTSMSIDDEVRCCLHSGPALCMAAAAAN